MVLQFWHFRVPYTPPFENFGVALVWCWESYSLIIFHSQKKLLTKCVVLSYTKFLSHSPSLPSSPHQQCNKFHMVFPFTIHPSAWCRKSPNLEEIWKWSNALLLLNTHAHTLFLFCVHYFLPSLSPSCLFFSALPPSLLMSAYFISIFLIDSYLHPLFSPIPPIFPDRLVEVSWFSCHQPVTHV